MKIGYHTVLLSIPIDFYTAKALFEALKICSKQYHAKHFKQEWKHISWTEFELFKDKGLRIFLKDYHYERDNQKFVYKTFEIRMNPKRLCENNQYVEVSQYEDYQAISAAFKKLLRPARQEYKQFCLNHYDPLAPKFIFDDISQYRVDRIDYCINIRIQHMKQYMELIRRADKPKTFEMSLEDNQRTKRKEPYKNAFRIENHSVVVNFYNKHHQMTQVFGNEFPRGQESEQIIRLEVQCMKRKVNNLKHYYGVADRSLLEFSNEELSEKVLLSYYEKTVGYEDYYTLQEARRFIHQSDYKRKDQERMIEVLELINLKRSVWKAREEYEDEKKKFNEALKRIKKMGINPVTIPIGWGLHELPNLLGELTVVYDPSNG
ncbi:hypothetical protein [Paenibacillus mesotrionivorans]|uniref:Uncharacterized protein n=1 Tax=Paenibacillus mesotrionivorans TaxID=3160968 RepID=A0ACC7NX98_9BACL